MFERIHPLLDGNGRTGRLLLNLILVRLGYPPAIIFKNERTKYLSAMRKADAGDLGPMGELIARSVTNNLRVRHTRRRRPGPAGATCQPGRHKVGSDRQRAPGGRHPRSPPSPEIRTRNLVELQSMGSGVPEEQVLTRLNCSRDYTPRRSWSPRTWVRAPGIGKSRPATKLTRCQLQPTPVWAWTWSEDGVE